MDGVFLCYTAARCLGNTRAALHWARRGLEVATIARGDQSRYAKFFTEQIGILT